MIALHGCCNRRKCTTYETCAKIAHVSQLCLARCVLIDFSLTVKAATLIFISGRGSAISSAKEGKFGFI